ncbi:chemotaxis signal transducer protein Htr8, partial [Halobacterium salinarum]|nr:chemotaxis signal transducer protein Htr8 [Halobacterium salinarum]
MGESARGGGSAETAGGLAAAVKTYLEYTPTGESIPAAAWRRRHRNVRVFVLAHIPLLLALGLYEGTESAVTGATIPPTPGILIAVELGIVGALVGLASIPSVSRRGRTALASTAVLASSVVLVQFSGGFIEAHFHFFVGMAVIAVYEDWLPFALGLVYVVFTHGVFGMINAERVYNHTAAINNPWVWGGIHGAFVLLLAGALMANWYSTERSREASQKRLEEARQKAQQVEDLEARQAEIEAEKAEAKRLKADAEEAREAAEAQQREVAALNERLEATANTYGAAMARAADGDLSVRLDPDVENDAMAAIAASFNEMLDETETTIREIQAVASDVAAASEDADAGVVEIEDASGQVSETVQEIAAGADEQREKLETVSGEMTDLSAAIE